MITVFVLGVLFVLSALAAYRYVRQKIQILQASNNVRCIAISVKTYAADQAFRLLFQSGLLGTESGSSQQEDPFGFGCPNSPFVPDGNIGTEPDYEEVLKPGECHWCITKGLRDDSAGNAPLIFENPNGHTWPPVWNCDAANQPVPGRAWRGGLVIIGRNDGSNNTEQLSATHGTQVGLQTNAEGKDLFTHWKPDGDFLPVER